ncbi:hypothetical protein [Thalassomonas haliotis]|uniref:Uncharacterized protein n=1 Tax=Thalassomonas haliotis TaxID=485448 RepID=A0ABY7VCA9_9GAMM|nr:hypothetical protein [Thalassomonas haliotis]WDE10553.1 hypothetical protein H3N35_20145 [Thalassomonas haliotis]
MKKLFVSLLQVLVCTGLFAQEYDGAIDKELAGEHRILAAVTLEQFQYQAQWRESCHIAPIAYGREVLGFALLNELITLEVFFWGWGNNYYTLMTRDLKVGAICKSAEL